LRVELKLICGVKECRYQDTREVAGNTQRDKMSRGEWEKADDEIQAGWEYADRGTKVGMLSGEKSDARIQTDGLYAYSGTETEVTKSWGILIPG